MAEKFVYVIYIEATPERVWQALTDVELTAQYWGHNNVSEWTAGSRWEHQRTDGTHT
ncbi:MAG TPA: SRPBCC domain-containing protein, partial [Thermopolyspora sp.]